MDEWQDLKDFLAGTLEDQHVARAAAYTVAAHQLDSRYHGTRRAMRLRAMEEQARIDTNQDHWKSVPGRV